MLLNNRHLFLVNPVTEYGNGIGYISRSYWGKNGEERHKFYGETMTEAAKKSCYPNGYFLPYSIALAPKSGGIGTYFGLNSYGSLTASVALGKSLNSTISCSGDLTANQLQTVISMAATLAATGNITDAQLVSFVSMVSDISTSGTFTAGISALSDLVAVLQAVASMAPEMNATAELSADISPFTELSPENLADKVWNSVASIYNQSGTMGEKLNAAGTAGDPWTADLDGYADGTAGKKLSDSLTEDNFLALK